MMMKKIEEVYEAMVQFKAVKEALDTRKDLKFEHRFALNKADIELNRLHIILQELKRK